MQKERELAAIKESLLSRQEEARAERDKLVSIQFELGEREKIFNELVMRQQSLSTTNTSNAFTDEFAKALRMLNKKTNEHRESNDSTGSCTFNSQVTKSGTFSQQLKESKACSDSLDHKSTEDLPTKHARHFQNNECLASQQLPAKSTQHLKLLQNNRSDPNIKDKPAQPSRALLEAGSPIEYLKRFKQQKRVSTTLAYDDKLADDTVIVDEKKHDLDETTPSSFR